MKKFTLLIISVLVTVAMMLAGCQGSSGKTDLKLGLESGKTYHTRMVTDQNIKQTVRGQEIDMIQKITNDLAFDVEEVSDAGEMTVRITFERIAADLDAGQRKISYDSSQPADANSPLATSFGAMAGQSYTMVVSERGEMLEISGMDVIIDRMVDSMNMPDTTMRERMREQMQRNFGEGQAQVMCGQMFGMMPPGPVAVGDEWNCSNSANNPFPHTWDQQWVLREVKGDVLVLDSKAQTSMHTGDEPFETGPIKMRLDMDGSQEGTLELDRETGLVVGGTLTSHISGQQVVEEGPEQLKGQVIPTELEQSITWQAM